MRRLVVAGALLLAGACGGGPAGDGWVAAGSGGDPRGDGSGHAGAGDGPGVRLAPITGWEPGCASAFAAAATAPEPERFAILARGCPACGVGWEPILAAIRVDGHGTSAASRLEVDAVVKACGGACSRSARDQFIAAFDQIKDDRTLDRPWRKLDRDCPGLLAPAPDGRYASAAWYVLGQIASKLGPGGVTGAVPVELPLPAAMNSGGGIELPLATRVEPALAAAYVTVLAKSVHVAAAPRVVIGGAEPLALTASAYPGPAIDLDALAHAISAAAPAADAPIGVVAPHAAPATRVREVVTAIGPAARLHLAAFAPGAAAGWPDLPRLVSPRLTPTVKPGVHVVIAPGTAADGGDPRPGSAGLLATGEAVRAGCTGDVATLVRQVPSPATAEVVIAIGGELIVDDLAAVIDALGAAGVTSVALVAGEMIAWPAGLQPCH